VEALVDLAPGLVLVSGTSRAITERLARLGLRFEAVPDTSLADLFAGIERIGALTGRSNTAGVLTGHVRADLDAVAERFADRPKVRVLLLTAPLGDPPGRLDGAGPGSFYDDLLRRAGHTNVVVAPAAAFAPLSLEYVVRANPDVIIELAPDPAERPNGDADAQRAWAGVGPLRAVAAQRVHVLVGAQYFVLGPRIAMTFEALCELIAGDRHE
jgi:ABC-type Fe3+-hydroxamate transport system substrate-binding protein